MTTFQPKMGLIHQLNYTIELNRIAIFIHSSQFNQISRFKKQKLNKIH